MARYARAKLRILDRQTPEDVAILNRDDRQVFAARNRGRGKKLFFSEKHHGAAWLEGGWLVAQDLGRIVEVARVGLRGRHNLQNALAATAAVRALGVGARPIARVLRTFRGLPHRLELVRRLRGVEYINNSMCTNPAAGARSLEAFGGQPVVLIAGGRSKGLPMDEYVRAICRHAGWVVLIGESRHELSRQLSRRGFRRFETASGIREAVRAAQQRAANGGVVLFAPGFASFDQFRDFQHRGEAFRREVKKLG
jgi:UDP-N-acetylmuramoylalanine--D-glutamate ligase